VPHDTSAWDACKDRMRPDGGLRDIIVSGTSSDDWDCFIATIGDWEYPAEFTVGGELQDIPSSYREVVAQQRHDPDGEWISTTLRLTVGSILVCCHFFPGQELEFDIHPRDVRSHVEFNQLLGFIRRIGQLFKKNVVLTLENEPEFPILQYEPKDDRTKFYPFPERTTFMSRVSDYFRRH
jgi:hypothetical protein